MKSYVILGIDQRDDQPTFRSTIYIGASLDYEGAKSWLDHRDQRAKHCDPVWVIETTLFYDEKDDDSFSDVFKGMR